MPCIAILDMLHADVSIRTGAEQQLKHWESSPTLVRISAICVSQTRSPNI